MYLFTRKRRKFPWRKYYNLRSYYSKKDEWLAKRRQPSAVGIWRNRIEYYFSLENYILRSLIILLFFWYQKNYFIPRYFESPSQISCARKKRRKIFEQLFHPFLFIYTIDLLLYRDIYRNFARIGERIGERDEIIGRFEEANFGWNLVLA